MDLTTLIAALPARYATLALALCGLAAAIAMFLPPPSATSSSTYRTVYGLVNLLAANKFHASNANAPASPLAGPSAPVLVLPLLLALTALSACAAQSSGPTPKAAILSMESALTAAERIALEYTTLPPCPGQTLCSDPAIVALIRGKDNVAYVALVAAQGAVDSDPGASAGATQAAMADAAAALSALQAATATLLKVK